MDFTGKTVLVLGLGESGLAMAAWLARMGARVRVADSRSQPPGAGELANLAPGAELVAGAFTEALLEDVNVLAISPGLDPRQALVTEARRRGIDVTGEIELFAQALPALYGARRPQVVAITGTNGKTTTTTLVGALCRAAGKQVAVAGNISPAALTALMQTADAGVLPEVWVLELSSFQLETCHSLAADAATVLNVSDDHLDRYDGLDDYAATKARIFSGARVAVLNRQDARVRGMSVGGCDVFSFGLDAPASEADYGTTLDENGTRWLCCGARRLLRADELALSGLHNVANALAALALCRGLGLAEGAVLTALREFKGLAHRVEKVAELGGVSFIDDSKGTNVGATVAALEGLGTPVALIAGGDGKGQDFSPLKEAFHRHARVVVLLGKDAERIAEAARGCGVPLLRAATMDEAVALCWQHARPGDAVLLSPACASLDMYRNYAHRAEVFIAAVRSLIDRESGVSA